MEGTGNDTASQVDPTPTSRTYLHGILILLAVVLLWVASNFLIQDLLDSGFQKPFFDIALHLRITYLSTASFALYLVPVVFRKGPSPSYLGPPSDESSPLTETTPSPLSQREIANLAKVFCVQWFMANWSLNAALGYTSVASCTILSSMSGIFTLIIGRILNVERFSLIRLAAVMASFIGVVLVSQSDSQSSSDPLLRLSLSFVGEPEEGRRPLLGDLLATLSALFYAIYVTLLKIRIEDESRVDMKLFFGYVGIYNIGAFWILGIILHLTGVEIFSLPRLNRQWGAILANMFITLSCDYLYVLAMLKTTPLVVTVGLSLTIPCALLGDLVFVGLKAHASIIFGALLVVSGFVILGVEDSVTGKWRRNGGRLTRHEEPTLDT